MQKAAVTRRATDTTQESLLYSEAPVQVQGRLGIMSIFKTAIGLHVNG